jgi:hypothetical protein
MFSTAESLARRGEFDIEQIRWMDLQQGTYGLDGLLYSRKGIGLPIALLPLTWLGLIAPWFGPVSVSLLFNPIITALTAVLLLGYLTRLGYNRRVGLIAALTFGLATLAWPYAKSLFSDPFSGLLLLAAAYALLRFKQTFSQHLNSGSFFFSLCYPLLASLWLGWNVATRYAEVIFLPIFGFLLLYYLGAAEKSRITRAWLFSLRLWLPVLAFAGPILIIGLSLLVFNLSRYGDPFNTGYLPNETFSGLLWEGIAGQLFSPGRGLFLYCPILLLSLWGAVPLFRRFPAEALLAFSIIVIHLLLYGKWFMWHGGYAWGPRFMIPTLPFWAIFLAPAISITNYQLPITDYRASILRSIFFALIVLSLIPQLLSVVIDFAPFQNSLLDTGLPLFARQTFFEPQYSPFIGGWRFLTLETLDLAWAWQGRFNGWLLAALGVNVVVTGLSLRQSWKGESLDNSPTNNTSNISTTEPPLSITNYQLSVTSLLSSLFSLLPYLSTLTVLAFLLLHTHALPSQALQEAMAELNQAIRPTDAIVTNDPEMAAPFAELYKGHTPVLGLNQGSPPVADEAAHRLAQTITNHTQVWWLPNWLPPEESGIEQVLLADGFRVRNDNYNGQRLVLLAYPKQLVADERLDEAIFDKVIHLNQVAYAPKIVPGSAFPIELHWQTAAPLRENYHIFIHLLDTQGQIMTQTDGQPGQWMRPTSTWAVGESIVDRHGLWIPPETAPGSYLLLVGVYRPTDGQRLPLADGAEAIHLGVRID